MSSSKYCLLVDDDPEDQEFFLDTLHAVSTNTGCYAVSNGEEALTALIEQNLSPDYIFTDLEMPVMNGFEFLRQLRAIEKYRTTPVIIYTGSLSEENIEQAKSLNVLAIYSKSRMSALKEILKRYFSQEPAKNLSL